MESKEEAIKIRDGFFENKKGLDERIKIDFETISTLEQSIQNARNEIEKMRPRLKGASSELYCPKCEIYSMDFYKEVPGEEVCVFEKWHKCRICGAEDYTDSFSEDLFSQHNFDLI